MVGVTGMLFVLDGWTIMLTKFNLEDMETCASYSYTGWFKCMYTVWENSGNIST